MGYSQPWDFVVVRDRARRERIRESFLRVRAAEAARFPAGERREQYLAYKLEGILDAAVNVCVTVDLRPADEAVLGTTAQPESLRWSACCAVQNLWLAARAEGIGVGWVSIVEPTVLRRELALPPGIEPVAYLCVGEPIEFRDRPLLEETGWRARRAVEDAIHDEQYRVSHQPSAVAPSARHRIRNGDSAIRPRQRSGGDGGVADALQAEAARSGGWSRWPPGTPARADDSPSSRREKIELYVFAGDHGVVEEGVSAWPSTVTAAMVGNMLAGGAAVNALAARRRASPLTVVDVGVAGDLSALPQPDERRARFVADKVRAGSANLRARPGHVRATKRPRAHRRRRAPGARRRRRRLRAPRSPARWASATPPSAAALVCALAGVAPEVACGHGAGLDDATVAHKARVVAAALARHRPRATIPLGALAAVGGLEMAAMAGPHARRRRAPRARRRRRLHRRRRRARRRRRSTPRVRDYLVAVASLGRARRRARSPTALGLEPLLDLGLRLGEGTGAILAAELVRHAVRLAARHGQLLDGRCRRPRASLDAPS